MNFRLQLPNTAKPGEMITVRLLIQHPMEPGFRRDDQGRAIPKNVIHRLRCRYAGKLLLEAELDSGVAANPLLQFPLRAETSGEVVLDWEDESGARGEARAMLRVQP